MVPPHGSRRYRFVQGPSGTRWYHTHVSAGRNLKRSTYTGQFGFDFVADNPGASLLHCHMQLHMDYGFMTMVEYAGLVLSAPPPRC